MENIYAVDNAYTAAAPPSSYEYTSSPLYPLSSLLTSSPSEDASPSPLSDDTLTDLPVTLDQDWECLSDILIDDALNSLPPASAIDLGQDLEFMTQDTPNDPQFSQSEATPSSPFTGALPIGSNSESSFRFEELPQDIVVPTMTWEHTQVVKTAGRGRGRGRGRRVATADLKKSSVGSEEQKKQKRRSQIALGVQRHREKKKCAVSSLQSELNQLTAHLATLRASRRAQLANNDELVAYEEEAMIQRRKRKQAEQNNLMLKQALFQQTAFLGGMKTIMGGSNSLLSKTLEFHDWVHSYTALTASDTLARRKEYVAQFPQSKMELAKNIVLQHTEERAQRSLTTREPFSGSVRILHDGTRYAPEVDEDYANVMVRELFGRPSGSNTLSSAQVDEGADGRVIKEYASVCLIPETDKCTLNTLIDIVALSMKIIGVNYTGVCYKARAADEVHLVEDDGMMSSCVYYSNLAASMDPVVEVINDADSAGTIDVEARVLTRVQYGRDEGVILWDYVDEDTLYPIPKDAPGVKAIRRNVCGAIVIRREIGTGLLSARHVSIKAYCPLSKPKSLTGVMQSSEAEEVRRAIIRRIGLQASECERTRDRSMQDSHNEVANRIEALYL